MSMPAEWISNQEFRVTVSVEHEDLSTRGEDEKWLPCAWCSDMNVVPSNWMAYCCSDECHDDYQAEFGVEPSLDSPKPLFLDSRVDELYERYKRHCVEQAKKEQS